jgi:hypothetical protein
MCYPLPNSENVPITADCMLTIKDQLPSTFVDPASLKFMVNGVDVTNEVIVKEREGTLYLHWVPRRVYN